MTQSHGRENLLCSGRYPSYQVQVKHPVSILTVCLVTRRHRNPEGCAGRRFLYYYVFCLCNSFKELFPIGISGGLPDLRVQRYELFPNRQNFSTKNFRKSPQKNPILTKIKNTRELHHIIITREKGPHLIIAILPDLETDTPPSPTETPIDDVTWHKNSQ